MRRAHPMLLAAMAIGAALAASHASAQTDAGPTPNIPARLIVEKNPADAASSGANAPILQAITYRVNVKVGLVDFDIVPDFHFTAPNGNAIAMRRELVATNGTITQSNILNATINIPAEAQKRGAVLSGGFRCGAQVFYVTMRATILDADGNRSNPMTYTIHCNGG